MLSFIALTYNMLHAAVLFCRYVILPKDFERGYKANIKKSDSEFAFYQ
jgi:hypothetical protein